MSQGAISALLKFSVLICQLGTLNDSTSLGGVGVRIDDKLNVYFYNFVGIPKWQSLLLLLLLS